MSRLVPGTRTYEVEAATLHTSANSLDTPVVNNNNRFKFNLSMFGLPDNTFRLITYEDYPPKKRFVLASEPDPSPSSVI